MAMSFDYRPALKLVNLNLPKRAGYNFDVKSWLSNTYGTDDTVSAAHKVSSTAKTDDTKTTDSTGKDTGNIKSDTLTTSSSYSIDMTQYNALKAQSIARKVASGQTVKEDDMDFLNKTDSELYKAADAANSQREYVASSVKATGCRECGRNLLQSLKTGLLSLKNENQQMMLYEAYRSVETSVLPKMTVRNY